MSVRDLFDANRKFQRRLRHIRVDHGAFVLDLHFWSRRHFLRMFRSHGSLA
jgi:hypothetical protein